MSRKQPNPPPPDNRFKPPPPTSPPPSAAAVLLADALDATAELATGVPLRRPSPLPILRNHDPAAPLGFLEFRPDGRVVATFKRGAVPLEALGDLSGGWLVTESDYEGPYPFEQFVRRAELVAFAFSTVSHNHAPGGAATMATTKKEPQLGDRVKDRVTGFKGIVVATTEWLNGCRRVGVQSEKLEEGKPGDPHWFDAPQCDVIDAAAHTPFAATAPAVAVPAAPVRRGGPQKDPSTRRAGE